MPPKRNLPRDVFFHLLAMVTLYWSAVSFVTLCWQYVNYFFPDILNRGVMNLSGPIRFAVASLVIVFPVCILVSWFLNRIYRNETAVRESKIRKWLIYLTLFIASLVIIGDLVSIINAFLGGEITIRFVLKALSIIVVAAVIFGYYLDDVRRVAPSPSAKYFAWGSGIAVAVLLVGAFFIIGSPNRARQVQIDQQRVGDLQGIQSQIVNYWQRKGQLPSALSDLNDSISGYAVPSDPATRQAYGYSVTNASSLQFELCATFDAPSSPGQPYAPTPVMYPNSIPQNWDHGAGHTCFQRQIDQQLYPPLNKGK